jgi:hypothetical protein
MVGWANKHKEARSADTAKNETLILKTLSSDTSLKAEQIQIKLIRESSISKRLLAVNSLVQTTRWLSWRAISDRYPDQTDQFLVERYLSFLYDDESLARRDELRTAFSGKLKTMKTPDILEVTFKVVAALEKLKIRYYIGGSLASSAFGVARSTLDVDIVAEVNLDQAADLENLLKNEFYVDAEAITRAIEQKSSFSLVHLESMFKIDVFILKKEPFSQQAFSRSAEKPVSEDPAQKLYFLTPEDIVLIKLDGYRCAGEALTQQWKDVLGVLKVQGVRLDLNYLRLWAKELKITGLLQKALEEAGMTK